jgi:hypothetical protein
MTFSKYEERHLAAERIKTDAQRIETTFKPLFDNGDYAVSQESARELLA